MQQSTPPRTASKQCAPRQGRRVSALADAYGRTIKHALRGADEEQFAECFPNIQPELLEILWQGYRQVIWVGLRLGTGASKCERKNRTTPG